MTFVKDSQSIDCQEELTHVINQGVSKIGIDAMNHLQLVEASKGKKISKKDSTMMR